MSVAEWEHIDGDRPTSWADRIEQHTDKTHAVVLGGAGFLGSHLSAALVELGARVTVVDSLITGRLDNLSSLPEVEFVEADICDAIPVGGPVDFVLNFASIASPPAYSQYPIETLRAGSVGVENALRLALDNDATYVQASTSEVYGDPAIVPQPEGYWGNVNPIGPRSMYDEAKRFAEALVVAYAGRFDLEVRLPRIFNTYGPRMDPDDGRAVPTFAKAALEGKPLPVHGDGTQTRTLCYVDDLVEGLIRLLVTPYRQPVNLGGTREVMILEIAELIRSIANSVSPISFEPRPGDDPQRRRPDISVARSILEFHPGTGMDFGLTRTMVWFAELIGRDLVIDLEQAPQVASRSA